ncbi:MAG: phosphatase PAP2 family protein [Pseudomonadota bacterium]
MDDDLERLRRLHPHYLRILLVEEMKRALLINRGPSWTAVMARNPFSNDDPVSLFRLDDPDSSTFNEAQIHHVLSAMDLRADRLNEIILQQTDLLSFLGATVRLSARSKPWTMTMLLAAQDVSTIMHSQIKAWISAPRPVDFCPETTPIIQNPPHSTYPSGHAVESFILATLLSRLEDPSQPVLRRSNYLLRTASRISINRTVAGVHFPVDSMPGAFLGLLLGEYLFDLMVESSTHMHPGTVAGGYHFKTQHFGGENFDLGRMEGAANGDALPDWLEQTPFEFRPESSHVLGWLYDRVIAEWYRPGGGGGHGL